MAKELRGQVDHQKRADPVNYDDLPPNWIIDLALGAILAGLITFFYNLLK